MRLYPHQAAMLDQWCSSDAFLLVTKTGTGKTRAVALPIVKHHESAVFVYPTKALIADQARAIEQLMRDEGVSYREWLPGTADDKLGDEEYALVQVSADTLEDFRKAWRMPDKSSALLRLLRQDKRKLVLVNPDVLYLVLSLRYGRHSAEAMGHLQAYKTVVFDEFHLYTGVELAHALVMIHMARWMHAFKRVVLLSATPNPEVRRYLDALVSPREIDATACVHAPVVDERTVAHDVAVEFALTSREDVVERARDKVMERWDHLRELQRINSEANSRGEYVPCVVILNSVVNAIALEDSLAAAGLSGLVPIRGLSAPGTRDLRDKVLVIGTSAIEVGIDFRTDYLVFEAGDTSSFIQRFGRIGRHRPGRAILLCGHREAQALLALGEHTSRDALERAVSAAYPQQDAYAWFVGTCGGMVSVCAQVHNFKRVILEDSGADEETKARVNQYVDEMLARYGQALGVERVLRQARSKLARHWFTHYAEIDTFRSSFPTQTVWDVREKERGREWSYDADVGTLLTRAERLWFNDRHRKLYVKGYGARRRVWFVKSFEDSPDLVGTIQTTADYPPSEMQFVQEGHLTSVSHVMQKPHHHIFVVVPAELGDLVGWRVTWFRCGARGRYIVAFDGEALLLKEVYDRWVSTVRGSAADGGPRV